MFLGASLQDLGSVGPSTLDLIDREVERLVGDAEAKAAAILDRNWQAVEETAHALLEQETLSGVALDAVLSTVREVDLGELRDVGAAGPQAGRGARALRPRATVALPALVAVAAALVSAGAPAARAEATWRLEQPPPPPGARFKVPLGTPDDMQFLAPNEGLLSVEGNAAVPNGLLFWNGRSWHQLSTVCGGSGEVSRIAWAGPDEFWTITEPSEPRVGSGLALCHFKDGVVVGSYSTPLQSPDPFRPMDAAACNGPNDCWFAGIGSEDPAGQRVGAYHLHWDGANLTSSYQPQGRGVSGLASFDGTFYESTFVGTQAGDRTDSVTLADAGAVRPDPGPRTRRQHVPRRALPPGTESRRAQGRHRAAVGQSRRDRPVALRRRGRLRSGRATRRLVPEPADRRPLQRRVLPAGPDRPGAVRQRRPLRRYLTGARNRKRVGCRPGARRTRQRHRPGEGCA